MRTSLRVVLAPDSFKESLTAPEAVAAMERGVRAACAGTGMAEPRITGIPMSDGGEGFTEAVAAALGAQLRTVAVPDALGRVVPARFAYAPGERVAAVECAQAVGLAMILEADRDVMVSSTVGVGRLLGAALDAGARRVVVGLGGSATNDGGAGLLVALGARLLDADGRAVEPVPARLPDLARIDASGLDPRLRGVSVEVACDVTNPLLGAHGASAVFAPQKGAGPGQVAALDAALAHFVRIAGHGGPGGPAKAPGAGAAGGLGYAFAAFCGAGTRPGVEIVAELTGLEAAVAGADLVVTGEGSIDAQTRSGKTPAGVAAIAARTGVPCLALAGRVGAGARDLYGQGLSAILPIVPGPMGQPAALAGGGAHLAAATEGAVRLFLAARGGP